MSRARSFVHEWIDLVERSGLLVSEPVLHRFFPGGPEHLEPRRQRTLLSAWERFQVDPSDAQRQSAWLDAVFFGLLEWPEERLVRGSHLPPQASVHLSELDQHLRPSAVLTGEGDRFLLGLWRIASDQKLDRVERTEGSWRATPSAKLERWLRQSGTPFGLLTSGSAFRLVHVPPGLPASWIEFSASTFFEEKSVLDGFWTLLRAVRFFGPAEYRLEHFAAESQKAQTELTESLGEQVRRAVEELILALDRADRGSREHPLDIGAGGRVFLGHDPDEIYKAAVYVVMRLVFILFAEEKSLLPHGNVFFDEGYGLGRLLYLLEEEKRTRPETFDREADAWPRLLALFRLIFLGSPHPDLPLPVYGGDLFSPTDFPALAALESKALRIPNRSIYAILRALTFGEAKVGKERIAQRYSYRNLDVEHIGYLYEGLLDHHAARAGREPLVKLANGTEVAIRLSELEALDGERLVSFLAERGVGGGDRTRIEAWLANPPAGAVAEIDRLPGDVARRCRPYAGVIQTDEIVLPGRLYLTTSSSRRATGTHYTPIQYTRAMVAETLEPLVYVGEHGKLEEPRRLRSPREILDLKVCDPAMGSGAFLVQVIRYLGEKLADSWQAERDRHGEGVALYLPYAEPAPAREDRIPLPEERTDAELWAMRLVAERCIYGVDKNPLAVEMAKLSIWLVTLDPQKPFSFVNHALKPGDSLLGISSLGQLRSFSLSGEGEQLGLLEERIAKGVQRAVQLRQQIGNLAVVTPAHVVQKERLLAEADRELRVLCSLADLLISTIMRSKKPADQEELRGRLLAQVSHLLDSDSRQELDFLAAREIGKKIPFHWPLGFPEVFANDRGGFDAFIGNPPFMHGQKLTGTFGEPYREFLVRHIAEDRRGSADLAAYFLLRVYQLLKGKGTFGILAVKTVAEGDARQVSLEPMARNGAAIYCAHPNEPWPGQASVTTSRIHVYKGPWVGKRLLQGKVVSTISAFLSDRDEWSPERLKANSGMSFQGSIILTKGFILQGDRALSMIESESKNKEVVFPYLTGKDLNSHPYQQPSRWVINFWDWPEEKARLYVDAYSIIEHKVKPVRQRRKPDGSYILRKPLPQRWWQYAEKRPALYHEIGRGHLFEKHPIEWEPQTQPMPAVIAFATQAMKHLIFARIDNTSIFSHGLGIFRLFDYASLAVLSSCFHSAWAWGQASKMRRDIRYTTTDSFETFPLPTTSPVAEAVGQEFHEVRRRIMGKESIGLTDLYNRFHNPDERSSDFDQLRSIQVKLDHAVGKAYQWPDLNLEHGFREIPYLPENDCIRFTISDSARRLVLDRLTELNREYYAREVSRGLHEKQGVRKKTTKLSAVEISRQQNQMTLWEPQASQTSAPAGSTDHTERGNAQEASAMLLDWLRRANDWQSRADAVEFLKLSTTEWNRAIQELLAAGLVERTGEKRGTRYRAKL